MARMLGLLLGIAAACLPLAGNAEQSSSFGDYTVHYNAFTADMLQPSVARAYDLTRSRNRAVLSIAVLKNRAGTTSQPTAARIDATATNLNAQLRNIDLREIRDRGAIYYIGEFPVDNAETLDFKLTVTPEGEANGHEVSFRQQFFTR